MSQGAGVCGDFTEHNYPRSENQLDIKRKRDLSIVRDQDQTVTDQRKSPYQDTILPQQDGLLDGEVMQRDTPESLGENKLLHK